MFMTSPNLKMIYGILNTHKLLIQLNKIKHQKWKVWINMQDYGTHILKCNKNKPRCLVFFVVFFTKLCSPNAITQPALRLQHHDRKMHKNTEERERVEEKGRRRFSQLLLGSVSSDSCFWLHSQFFPLDVRKHGCLELCRVKAKDTEC